VTADRLDYDDDLAEGAAVRHRVWAPAVALMAVGGIGMAGGTAAVAFGLCVLLGVVSVRPGTDAEMMVGFLAVFSAIAVAWSAVIALGGRRMMRCRNRDLATTGAVFCILTAPMYLVSPVVVPVGVWALYILTRPDVKAEFTRVRWAARGAQ
jgi:hypothetical protein